MLGEALMGRHMLGTIVGVVLAWGGLWGTLSAAPPDAKGPPPTQLDELPPLLPRKDETEAERDQREAVSLFAAARMKLQQGREVEALRLYQRALRLDPGSKVIVQQIVQLAFRLNRSEEAVRYALKGVELGLGDVELIRRLGQHLVSQRDWKQAIHLFEKAVAANRVQKPGDPNQFVLLNELGRLYFVNEQFAEAAAAFGDVRQALEDPEKSKLGDAQRRQILSDPVVAWELFGTAFLEAGRLDEAQASFEKSFAASKKEGVYGYHQAAVLAKRKDPAAALAKLEAYFKAKESSKLLEPYELLETLLTEQKLAETLVPRLETLLTDDGKNQPLRYFLADRYLKAKRYEDSAKLHQALLAERFTGDAFRGLLEAYRETAQVGGLIELLGQAVKAVRAVEALGESLDPLLKNAELIDKLRVAADERAKAGELTQHQRLAMGGLLLKAGRFDDGARFYEAAIEAEPKQAEEHFRQWGLSLLVADEYRRAADVLRRAIDKKVAGSDNAEFHYFLATALEYDGQTDEALKFARQAAEIGDTPMLHARAPWVLYHAKRYAEAATAYKALIEKYVGDQSSQARDTVHDSRIILSNLYVLLKDLPQAEEWLQLVLDENPDDVGALNDLGYLWADQNKNLARALEMTRRAAEAKPDNAAYRDSYGWALFRVGRYEEAVVELKKAVELEDKPDAVMLDHLGDALRKLKQPDAARDAWRRALEQIDPKNPEDAERSVKIREKLK